MGSVDDRKPDAGHPSEDDLVLYHYRETAGARATRAHLDGCERCRASYESLARVLAAVDASPVPEPREGFEARIWARIEPRLAESREPWWLAFFLSRRVALVAGVATLVLAAFVAGRNWPRPDQPGRSGAPAAIERAAAPSEAGLVRERILFTAVGQHLDRSQIALVEFVNSEPSPKIDISNEQARAEDLIAASRLLRQTAAGAGEEGVARVLDDIERVLLDIARGPSELSRDEFENVRLRIESEGLIFKVRVAGETVRQREEQAARGGARATL